MGAEHGWYTDPSGRHEARWFDQGEPTKLVCDGTTRTFDELPNVPPTWTPVPVKIKERWPIPDDADPRGPASWPWRIGRFLVVVALAIVVGLVLHHGHGPAPPRTAPAPVGPPSSGAFHYVGTLVEQVPSPGIGTVSLAYSVASPIAPLRHPAPRWAQQAFEACQDVPGRDDVVVLARVTVTLNGSWGTSQLNGGFLSVPEPSLGAGDINEPATALDEAPPTDPGASIVPLGLREATYGSDWVCGDNGQQLGDLATTLAPPL